MLSEIKQEALQAWQSARVSLYFVLFLWLIKLFEVLSGVSLSYLGNQPMTQSGLKGIVFSPLLHGNLEHIASNTIPLFVLSSCLLYFYRRVAWFIIPLIWLGSGALVWFFGRPSIHIGASGLIYGFASFLFFSGFIKKNIPLLSISLLVTIFYGGMIWGVLPIVPGMSWESHLSGAFLGLCCAWLFRHAGPQNAPASQEDDSFNDPEHWNIEKMSVPPPFRIDHKENED